VVFSVKKGGGERERMEKIEINISECRVIAIFNKNSIFTQNKEERRKSIKVERKRRRRKGTERINNAFCADVYSDTTR
jgi:hypothetical protein